MSRGVAILGSTGSVGVSAISVVSEFPDELRIVALAAGRNVELLAEQVRRFRPRIVSVAGPPELRALRELLRRRGGAERVDLVCGAEGAAAVARCEGAEVVLAAMVGAVGLRPALAALRSGATLAIANKEPLVIAGELLQREARRGGGTILPVDSEHSAVFQCLRGHRREDVRRLLLTASGGPFRTTGDLASVTVAEALAHPIWSMGPKVTVDSATLMNKGLEVIEARWLFDIPAAQIEVVIHPESIVHSAVEFRDGALLAQMGPPDMRIPIAYALAFPARLPLRLEPIDLFQVAQLTFAAPDLARFPCLGLAYEALAAGGTAPAVLNAANEVAVRAFLDGQLRYLDIARVIETTLEAHRPAADPDLETLLAADAWARGAARAALERISRV